MTQARFQLHDGLIEGFTLAGHSGAGEAGFDVVCAAISSAAYLTANTVTEICRCRAEVQERNGYLQVQVAPEDIARCQDILAGFRLHMEQLQQQYSEWIQVQIMEV